MHLFDKFTHMEDYNPSAAAARDALTQAALTFYQCKDGSLVQNPLECKESKIQGPLEFPNIYE